MAACQGDTTAPVVEPDVRQFVVGQAAARVDASGHFVIADTVASGSFPTVDASTARALAHAYLRTFAWPDVSFGAPLGAGLEKQHGGPIHVDALSPMNVVLAHSPYEDAPAGAPVDVRNYLAPKFVVRLWERSVPAVAVAVSAYAADVQVSDGKVILPIISGNEFQAFGNPIAAAGYAEPIGPERAVVVAARATGALVSEVPELLLPQRGYYFVYARWKVTLDRDATFMSVTSGAVTQSRVVYVGQAGSATGVFLSHEGLFLPSLQQQDLDTVRTNPLHVAVRRSGVPTRFDRVTAVR